MNGYSHVPNHNWSYLYSLYSDQPALRSPNHVYHFVLLNFDHQLGASFGYHSKQFFISSKSSPPRPVISLNQNFCQYYCNFDWHH